MVSIGTEFADQDRLQMSQVIWSGLGHNFNVFFGPEERGIAYWAEAIVPGLINVVRDEDSTVVGVSCARTHNKNFMSDDRALLVKHYGQIGGTVRHTVAKLDEKVPADRYLIDVLCVDPSRRGRRLGNRLLQACFSQAEALGKSNVALGVDAQNVDAIRLYETVGFREIERKKMGLLRPIFGIDTLIKMERKL
ncbi:MAG: GNAT family N-acetyltransferase [Pseudomonadota bacterium]